MADFHEYYSGARKAPYLTIFIGGNHEASNHLFELYYGGWVAPNVYYLGAANILRLGPLRIAGLSGIWKGYDYRKPHFERVPYNETESVSIFHVRELDVRKMLSIRTQVDVGLSHDWPQGVEWKGDYRSLFRKKDRFEADANEGKLGSVAARQCLDRLRPSHWFSAHLHIKYAAVVQHGDYEWVRPAMEHRPRHGTPLIDSAPSRDNMRHQNETASNVWGTHTISSSRGDGQNTLREIDRPLTTLDKSHQSFIAQKSPEQAQVSAWQNFHVDVVKEESEETERRVKEQRERTAEEERTGTRSTPQYVFDETWKQIELDNSDGRGVASILKSTRSPGAETKIPTVDGCIESKLKRPRSTTPEGISYSGRKTPPLRMRNGLPSQLDGQMRAPATTVTSIKNSDEIDINLSDSASEHEADEEKPSYPPTSKSVATHVGDKLENEANRQDTNKRVKSETLMSDDSDEGGVKLGPTSAPFVPNAGKSFQSSPVEKSIKEEQMSDQDQMEVDEEKVSDALRAQLAELSSSFAPVSSEHPVSTPLPLPENIKNGTTQFLALDKCDRGRDFLQLLELAPISEQTDVSSAQPYRLQYDPEWLAILRVFAPELKLGGDANERTPQHRGDTYYRERIIEEEKWIEKNVLRPGRLMVPENFTITAPVYDPNEEVASTAKPHEYTNPQTSTFCELIGIENKFDISKEEREMRMARGPRPADKNFYRGDRGGGRGGRGNGNNARGRGGHNASRGGRARGRAGRGRGRGGW
jgi:lariat debranching enzyme